MNEIHQKRLLNVAKALRESEYPERFNMQHFVHGQGGVSVDDPEVNFCGTPACALGHYGARRDLQRTFEIDIKKMPPTGDYAYEEAHLIYSDSWRSAEPRNFNDRIVGDTDGEVQEHFGLSYEECKELFGFWGCDQAKTPKAAARYIERFVARKMREAKE